MDFGIGVWNVWTLCRTEALEKAIRHLVSQEENSQESIKVVGRDVVDLLKTRGR
jgi:hypothetical protein